MMNLKTSLVPTLLLALAAAGLATPNLWQDAGAADQETTAKERRDAQLAKLKLAQEDALRKSKEQHILTLRDMQGAWQLIEYRSAKTEGIGRQDAAFMLVGDEFLSIEIHMAYFDEQGTETSSYLQSGIYRLNFNPDGDLMAVCLIGSLDDGSGYTSPQVPGVVSTYTVEQSRGSLFMTNGEGSRFEFERVARGALTDLIYEETDWLPGAEGREQRRLVREASAKKN